MKIQGELWIFESISSQQTEMTFSPWGQTHVANSFLPDFWAIVVYMRKKKNVCREKYLWNGELQQYSLHSTVTEWWDKSNWHNTVFLKLMNDWNVKLLKFGGVIVCKKPFFLVLSAYSFVDFQLSKRPRSRCHRLFVGKFQTCQTDWVSSSSSCRIWSTSSVDNRYFLILSLRGRARTIFYWTFNTFDMMLQ